MSFNQILCLKNEILRNILFGNVPYRNEISDQLPLGFLFKTHYILELSKVLNLSYEKTPSTKFLLIKVGFLE